MVVTMQPAELLSPGTNRPRSLRINAVKASSLASTYGLKLVGEDLEITALVARRNVFGTAAGACLTFLVDLQNVDKSALVLIRDQSLEGDTSSPFLLSTSNAVSTFCSIASDLEKQGKFEQLSTFVHPSAKVAASAILYENSYIDRDAVIGPGAIIYPNTYVGEGVIISPNATIGNTSLKYFDRVNRLRLPSTGGVWLESGVEIRPSSCIDRGTCGAFTFLGEETKIDNLIHIGSDAFLGKRVSLPGSSYVGEGCVVDDDVWIGPKTAVADGVHIGHHAYIGTGCLIANDLPAQALVYGLNSRAYGWACYCRGALEFKDGKAQCRQCGEQFSQVAGSNAIVPMSVV